MLHSLWYFHPTFLCTAAEWGLIPCLAALVVLIPRDTNCGRDYCSIPFPFEVPLSAPTCLSLVYPFSVLITQLLMFVRVTGASWHTEGCVCTWAALVKAPGLLHVLTGMLSAVLLNSKEIYIYKTSNQPSYLESRSSSTSTSTVHWPMQ